MVTFNELMSLQGRRALVTGATGAIGRIASQTLAELGADLVLVDRPGSNYATLLDEVRRYRPVRAETFDCDLEVTAERDQLCAHVKQDGLNILVNNAALVGTSALEGWGVPFEQQSIDTWRRAFEVNLTAVFHITKELAATLRKAGGASVINVGSVYGQYAPDYSLYEGTSMGNPAAYGASKAGLMQLTRWLATTLAPTVRVNAISPGGVFRQHPDAFVHRYEQRTPLGRMAKEDDFRGALGYLASDLSAYVTGQNLAVDGGWGVW